MNATPAITWFDAMTNKVAALEKGSRRSVDWEQSLGTVHFRVTCFAFHRDEFVRLVGQLPLGSARGPLESILPVGEDGDPLSINTALAAAQLMAAAQALHAACGGLFRTAFYALELNVRRMARAHDQLSPEDVVEHAFGQSKVELDKLASSSEFQYLDGFVLVSKRRNLLTTQRRRHASSNVECTELLIREFQHTSKLAVCSFTTKWATDFLLCECERIITYCNSLGAALAKEMV